MPARKILLGNGPEVNSSATLKKQLEKIVAALQKQGVPEFEASFVTYKSEPNVPEFYDFLVTT